MCWSVIGAQVTIRERSTPTNTATFQSEASSLNNLILPPPPTSNTEQLSAADNSDIQISWRRQTEQTSECRMTSTPRPDWDYILIVTGICPQYVQARQTSVKLLGANKILMPVAIHRPADWPESSRNLSRFYTEIWVFNENWLNSSLTLDIFQSRYKIANKWLHSIQSFKIFLNNKRINILCFVSLSLNWYLRDPHPTLFALRLTATAGQKLLKYEFESGLLINCFLASPYLQCFVSGVKAPVAPLTLLAIYSCITDLNHGLWGPGPWLGPADCDTGQWTSGATQGTRDGHQMTNIDPE